ncbi:MAG: HAMP domain-containing sensor histidine kinase [Chitinophagaceae bacterium]
MKNYISNYKDIERIGSLSNDGIFIYNVPLKKFLYFNKSFSKIFNQKATAVRDNAWVVTNFLKAEDTFYLRRRFEELMRTGCITSTEFRLQFSNNKLRHISCDIFALEHKKILVGFVKDVTNAKEHEDFIINTGARKDTLLDMVTHNLAGPLNLSKNLLESVDKSFAEKNPSAIGDDIKILLETTQQCIEIVNDFLQKEHQESAHVFVKKSRFDLIEKIKATLEKLKVTNPDKKFRLITKLENLNISTDSVKFFQSIHILVSNAIKFTPENGEIDIIVIEHKKFFTISIRDNGIGIPAKYHPLLFYRRNAGSRPGLKGEKSSGLGLSIARKLIDLLDGQIWFKSTVDKGSVFYIRLPKE